MLQVRGYSPFPIYCHVLILAQSNALTLERVTSEYPKSGSLITFCQFFLISLYGLPNFVSFTRGPFNIPVPRFRPRRIPLTPYLIQVGLFYLISLLNNFAFSYDIPMPVHIIFRSGGLIISMLMGWLISRKS
jgi:UDP-xylose/UDP-N-acetylglucosamine transporter B4